MKTLRIGALLVGFVSLAVASSGWAQPLTNEDLVCAPERDTMSGTRYLRALSLHLRGVVPTEAEYRALDDDATLESLVSEWLESPEFEARFVRYHRSLLWNNISNIRIVSLSQQLGRSGDLYWAGNKARVFRGDRVSCRDEVVGTLEEALETVTEISAAGVERRRERAIMVEPYWAPGTLVKVCGFDAQEVAISARGTNCDSSDATNDAGCGCGPNLQRCTHSVQAQRLRSSFGLEIEQRLVAHLRAREPYHALFTSRRGFVNGPLAHFWRYQHFNSSGGTRMTPAQVDVEDLPVGIEYTDEDWYEIELNDAHSGVLTSPSYLIRFQTNRARAGRFYDAFLCEPFQPPAGGIPASSDEDNLIVDTQVRPGCAYCHAQLEPAAARWGRWAELGAAYLDPLRYPVMREDCQRCAQGQITCSLDCRFNYVTQSLSPSQQPYLGMLLAYEFRRPEHEAFVEDGPSRMVYEAIADGRLPRCTARRAFEWLVGREVHESEEAWLEQLAFDFTQGGFDYRSLVRAIVLDPTYRRLR